MNSTTKKFLSAILTTAIVFTQAGTTVSAANYSAWGTLTSQFTQSASTKTTSKNYNHSSDYTDTDKYGNAFPYSYYYQLSHNKAYKTLYKSIADALRDRKASLRLKGYAKKYSTDVLWDVIAVLRRDCPDLYYVNHCYVNKSGNDIIIEFNYLDEAAYKANKKKIDKYIADFDAYLAKNNVTSTKGFLKYAAKYVENTVSYNYKAAKGNRSGKVDKNSLNIIGAIVEGKAVCEGYARTFNLLCMTHGVPFAVKRWDSTDSSGHMTSCVVYNNVWYNFDPTAGERKDLQMVTDADYVKLAKKYYKGSYSSDKLNLINIVPTCNGKKTKFSSSTSKVTSKSALLNNWDNRMLDAGYISRFEGILKNNFSDYASDYDTFTYTFPSKIESYMKSCVAMAEKLKKAGTISYKSIEICTPETGERFILIYLK